MNTNQPGANEGQGIAVAAVPPEAAPMESPIKVLLVRVIRLLIAAFMAAIAASVGTTGSVGGCFDGPAGSGPPASGGGD